MNSESTSIRTIIRYGLLIIIPLIISLILLAGYNLYLSMLRNLNNASYEEMLNQHQHNFSTNNGQEKNIKRLSFLKYTHQNGKDGESVYLIELVQVGNCKYIIVSKKDQDPVILHAADCDNPLHNSEK